MDGAEEWLPFLEVHDVGEEVEFTTDEIKGRFVSGNSGSSGTISSNWSATERVGIGATECSLGQVN